MAPIYEYSTSNPNRTRYSHVCDYVTYSGVAAHTEDRGHFYVSTLWLVVPRTSVRPGSACVLRIRTTRRSLLLHVRYITRLERSVEYRHSQERNREVRVFVYEMIGVRISQSVAHFMSYDCLTKTCV